MKILIITQNDNLFLPQAVVELVSKLKLRHNVVGSIVLDVSPFGKKESLIRKARKTLQIFGVHFFLRYSFQFLKSKIRRNSVLHVLQDANVNVLHLTGSVNSIENIKLMKDTGAELLISLAANEIFRKRLYEEFKYGCINLHTALLPKYRGLMPSFWVLRNDEKFTGVTVFKVDEGIDSGPILLQEVIELGDMTQRELIQKSKSLGVNLLVQACDAIEDGSVELKPNDAKKASYFGFPTRSDVRHFHAAGKKFF